jgi:hypothetical protein
VTESPKATILNGFLLTSRATVGASTAALPRISAVEIVSSGPRASERSGAASKVGPSAPSRSMRIHTSRAAGTASPSRNSEPSAGRSERVPSFSQGMSILRHRRVTGKLARSWSVMTRFSEALTNSVTPAVPGGKGEFS